MAIKGQIRKSKFQQWNRHSFGVFLQATLTMLLAVVLMSCESARACSNSNWVNLIGGEEVNVLKTYVAPDDKDNLFVAA